MKQQVKYYSVNLPIEIQNIVNPYQFLIVKSEADFYGASCNIALKLGKKQPPRSYSSWTHGCTPVSTLAIEEINWADSWSLNILVKNNEDKKFMEQHGFKNVHAVGVPINYTESIVKNRLAKSILFMPAHSLSYVLIKQDINDLAKHALNLKSQGYYVCFCVHQDCVSQGDIINLLNNLEIDWFAGATVRDIYSLQRMRNIFESFEIVLSNTMGSHFFYSQLFGAKFSFIEPYFEYNPAMFANDPFWVKHPDLCKSVILSSSKLEIQKKYPEYFNDFDPKCDQKMAKDVCGSHYVRSYDDIANLLGWSKTAQMLCPLPYFGSKFFNKLKTKLIKIQK